MTEEQKEQKTAVNLRIGQKYGFEIVEILTVAQGGWHNDTIVVVERKVPTLFDL